MSSRIERLLIALVFALFAAGVTLVIASAQGEVPPPAPIQQTSPTDCVTCHKDSQLNWEEGAHAQAGVVTCEACHGPVPADHPNTPMKIDRSADLCVRCHSDTSFGLQNWQESRHAELGIDCASCHDPHNTTLKQIAGPREEAGKVDDVSALCSNCHQTHSSNFTHSTHSQEGLTCVDCHVNPVTNPDTRARTVTNHTFNANLESCNTCHAEQMHDSAEAKAPEGSTTFASGEQAEETQPGSTASEPQPISPLGFSALAGIIGLAGGMVLAPWLERWYRRTIKSNREEDHE